MLLPARVLIHDPPSGMGNTQKTGGGGGPVTAPPQPEGEQVGWVRPPLCPISPPLHNQFRTIAARRCSAGDGASAILTPARHRGCLRTTPTVEGGAAGVGWWGRRTHLPPHPSPTRGVGFRGHWCPPFRGETMTFMKLVVRFRCHGDEERHRHNQRETHRGGGVHPGSPEGHRRDV